ncbi:MAG: hypothetical protein IKR19_08980 [Acholeplasmatales bacterium]|nr:hypothetical protein [Acholeplasmatales bacterium]
MQFENYDRVVDTLIYFTDEITFKFTVVLAKNMSKTNTRRFFQYEVEKASKYVGGNPTRNINRSMTFFFSIDIKNEFGGGFVIKPGDAYMLLDMINRKVLPWYYGDSKKNAFQYVNKVLVLKEYEPAIYTQSDVRYLKFEPRVLANMDGQFSYGCNININGLHELDITLETLIELVRFLSTDMYATACSIVNYAKIQPYGTNLYRPAGLGSGRADNNDWGSEPVDYSNKDNTDMQRSKNYKSAKNNFLESL